MTNHQYVTVTRTLLKRGATDIERKVKAYFASGAAGLVVLQIVNEVAKAYKIDIPPTILESIPWAVGLIGGYVVHSVGVTTHTITTDKDGNTVESTATGAIALPVPGASLPVQSVEKMRLSAQYGKTPTYKDSDSISTPTPAPVPVPEPAPVPEPEVTPYEVPDQASDHLDYDAATQVIPPTPERAQAWANKYLPSNGN